MGESSFVTNHINTLNTLFSQLTASDFRIAENECAELLLPSLPDLYDQLINNITNNNIVDTIHFDDVAGAILEEESRGKNKEERSESSKQAEALTMTRSRLTERGPSGSQNHVRSKSRRKKNLKCYSCGMRGHLKKECWNNKKNGEKTSEASTSQGCVASDSDDEKILYSEEATDSKGRRRLNDVWIMDLGATWHMTPHRDWFFKFWCTSNRMFYAMFQHQAQITDV